MALNSFCLVLGALGIHAVVAACPAEWQRFRPDGANIDHCYFIDADPTWSRSEARRRCLALDATLMAVAGESEWNWLNTLSLAQEGTWVGLIADQPTTDRTSAVWYWENGESTEWLDMRAEPSSSGVWATGDPRASSSFGQLWQGLFTDRSPEHLGGLVCEKADRLQMPFSYPLSMDVRIVDSNGDRAATCDGRVEVRRDPGEAWGTVCDDGADDASALALCRASFGCHTAVRAALHCCAGRGAGPDTQEVKLSYLQCPDLDPANHTQGVGQLLDDCNHAPHGTHSCRHSEDLGVTCFDADDNILQQSDFEPPSTMRLKLSRAVRDPPTVAEGQEFGSAGVLTGPQCAGTVRVGARRSQELGILCADRVPDIGAGMALALCSSIPGCHSATSAWLERSSAPSSESVPSLMRTSTAGLFNCSAAAATVDDCETGTLGLAGTVATCDSESGALWLRCDAPDRSTPVQAAVESYSPSKEAFHPVASPSPSAVPTPSPSVTPFASASPSAAAFPPVNGVQAISLVGGPAGNPCAGQVEMTLYLGGTVGLCRDQVHEFPALAEMLCRSLEQCRVAVNTEQVATVFDADVPAFARYQPGPDRRADLMGAFDWWRFRSDGLRSSSDYAMETRPAEECVGGPVAIACREPRQRPSPTPRGLAAVTFAGGDDVCHGRVELLSTSALQGPVCYTGDVRQQGPSEAEVLAACRSSAACRHATSARLLETPQIGAGQIDFGMRSVAIDLACEEGATSDPSLDTCLWDPRSVECDVQNQLSGQCEGYWRQPELQVRLVGGSTACDGLVEVNAGSGWRVLCDDGFNQLAAEAVCNSIRGCHYAASVTFEKAVQAESSSGFWESLPDCSGLEGEQLDMCTLIPQARHCGSTEHVSVACSLPEGYAAPTPGPPSGPKAGLSGGAIAGITAGAALCMLVFFGWLIRSCWCPKPAAPTACTGASASQGSAAAAAPAAAAAAGAATAAGPLLPPTSPLDGVGAILHRGYIQLPQGPPLQLAIVQGSIADGIQHRDIVMFGTSDQVSEGPVPQAVRQAWQAKNSDAWKTAFERGHRISSHRVAATFKYDAPGARGANRTFWAVAINPPHADASTGRAQGDDLQTAVADGLRQVLPQVTPGADISIATVALGTGNFKWSAEESVAEVVRGLQDPSLAGLVGPHCELVVYAFSAAMGQAASSWYSAIQSGNVVPLLAPGSATAVLPTAAPVVVAAAAAAAPAAAAAGWGRAATTTAAAAAGPPGVTPGGFFAIDASLGDHVSPAWWQTRCNGGKYPARRMVAVPSGTAEYRAVEAALHATLPRRRLIRVERNENMAAWAMFVQRQRTVLNLPGRTSPNELHMWHGTSGTDPDLILQNGVDPRRARDSGYYGRGGYHALAAAYSDRSYAYRNGQQEKVLILCRVTRGRFKDVQDALEQHTVEPPGYDSVQSTRDTANRWPGTFNCIVYSREHSYPEYKVVYSATD